MKKLMITIFSFAILLLFWSSLDQILPTQIAIENSTVLVQFIPDVLSEENYEYTVHEIDDDQLYNTLSRFGITSIRSVFKNRYDTDGRIKKSVESSCKKLLSGWFELSPQNTSDISEFVAELKKQSIVVHAFINASFPMMPDIAPDDPNYGSQWHLNNPSFPNFDIAAESAWEINKGRNDVIIAVLDGGVDYSHPDLDPGDRSRVIAGIDTGDGNNDPMDDLPDNASGSYAGHGTKIAGVIGAITDNGQQVAGVMWNSKIMPVKMVRSGGIRIPHILNWDWSTAAFPSDVADAIDYAINNGADVINLSYSFPDLGWPVNEIALQVPLLFQAVNNAYQNNVVITASMGNSFETNNSRRYPAGFNEQVIAVGATNQIGSRSAFSNTGSHINLSAPGTGIWTTERGGGIGSSNGTSFSAPIVAGVAGLVISQGRDRGFNLTNDDVRHIMELTANGQAGPNPGFDNETGHGVVNAHHALQLLDEPNELFHYSSTGGTEQMVQNLSQWILLSGRWGLAPGTYFNVDQYKVTKRVDFEVPFCSSPVVWMRERQSQSLSYANPNFGEPFTIISNVDNTGFDLEYVTYYVRTNASGQTINKWIPLAPQSTQVAYTVVGEPNPAALSGPISGPDYLCSSNTFTLQNAPAGSTVSWSVSPTNLFSGSTSGSGSSAPLSPYSSSVSGQATITFDIETDCGEVPVQQSFWVGRPSVPGAVFGHTSPTVGSYEMYQVSGGFPTGATSMSWVLPFCFGCSDPWSIYSGPNLHQMVAIVGDSPGYVQAMGNNTCGNGPASLLYVVPDVGGGSCNPCPFIYPNPASEELFVEWRFEEALRALDETDEYEVALYDMQGARLFSGKSSSVMFRMDLSKLRNGFYYIHILHKEGLIRKQIRVER